MRALIVDDSHFIREYLRQHLERLGWVCAEAHDGRRACYACRRRREPEMLST